MCLLPSLITLVVLNGQERLVSAEQPSAVGRNVPPQASPEFSLTTVAARAGIGAGAETHRVSGSAMLTD